MLKVRSAMLREFFVLSFKRLSRRAASAITSFLLITAVVFLINPLLHTDLYAQEKARPKVGLVLSGGGAKGFSYIGVLKVLEEEGIRIDYITGTSIGALIGGLYASGYSVQDLERIVKEIDWQQVFSDKTSRRHLNIEERYSKERYILNLPMDNWSIVLPKGLIAGQNISMELSRLTAHVHHIKDFSKLPVPFKCIATDIETGEVVVLDRGSLPRALRASMSVPSMLVPVRIGGRSLVDGGLVRNLPVQEVIDMGADIVIAVDVGTTLKRSEELNNISQIMDQTLTIYALRNNKEQRAMCDLVIDPDLAGVNTASFNNITAIIHKGEVSALRRLPEIRELAKRVSADREKPGEQDSIMPFKNGTRILIRQVKIAGLKQYDPSLVKRKMRINPGDRVTLDEIEETVKRIYGTGYFEQVTYEISREGTGAVLHISVVEKVSDSLNIGLRYDTDLKAAVLVNATLHNYVFKNSTICADIVLGDNPMLHFSYTNPLYFTSFLYWNIDLKRRKLDIFYYEEREKAIDFSAAMNSVSLALRTNYFYNVMFLLGAQFEYTVYEATLSAYELDESGLTVMYLNPYCSFYYDTLDRVSFPTRGISIMGSFKRVHEIDTMKRNSYEAGPVNRFYALLDINIPMGKRLTLQLNGGAGMITGQPVPYDYYYYIGGINTIDDKIFAFPGLQYMEIMATRYFSAGLGLQFEPFKSFFVSPFTRFLNYSNEKDLFRGDDVRKSIVAFGVKAGILTPVGPVSASYAMINDSDEEVFDVSIGFRF